jgi:hypothetical protein
MVIPGPGRRRSRGWPRLTGALLLSLAAYVAYFAFSARSVRYPLAAPLAQRLAPRGAYHVHSTASDGRGTPTEIAGAAKAAGLQFVIITDHNQAQPPPPAYVDGVLLIYGSEVSTPYGHLVALGLKRPLTDAEKESDPVGAVAKLGGFGFLAHPEQQKNPWRDWDHARQAAGLEVYSADTMFRTAQHSPFSMLGPAASSYLTNPTHGLLSLAHEQSSLTMRLLSLGAGNKMAALCSHDAHGLPGYESVFRTLSMYVPPASDTALLPADPVEAAGKVVSDLANGRGWCAFQGIADGDGFRIDGLTADRGASTGDVLRVQLPPSSPSELRVRVWGPATVMADGHSIRLEGPGAVQVEVWARVPGMHFDDGWRPWLVASPIAVGVRAATPPPPRSAGPISL